MECREEKNYIVLELNEPPGNSLKISVLKKLYQDMKMAEEEKKFQGVILVSCNKNTFSSGLDLGELMSKSKWKTRLGIVYSVWLVHKLATFIVNSNKIYVAGAEGAVIGSAVTLFAACDQRIGTEHTWFWIPDPQYGGLLADGGIELLRNLCGITNAGKICLTNKRVQAEEARQWGLLHQVVKHKDLTEYCDNYSEKLLHYSYDTLKHTKHILNQELRLKFHVIRILKSVFSKEMMRRLKVYF